MCCGTFRNDKFFCVFLVISRNILTEPSSSQPTADELDSPAGQADSSSPSSDLSQSGPPGGAAVPQEPIENPEMTGFESTAQEASRSGNSSVLVAGQTELLSSTAGKESRDPAKPAHADEM